MLVGKNINNFIDFKNNMNNMQDKSNLQIFIRIKKNLSLNIQVFKEDNFNFFIIETKEIKIDTYLDNAPFGVAILMKTWMFFQLINFF